MWYRDVHEQGIPCLTPQKEPIGECFGPDRHRHCWVISGLPNSSGKSDRGAGIPNGNPNPDPNRTQRDAWDTASFRAGQKMVGVSNFLASAVHSCHGGDESIISVDGTFRTCNQSLADAATNSVASAGLAANTVRWCDKGLNRSVNVRAVDLLHELTHQDRTNDATGGHVFDTGDGLYNAQNWSNWYNNNQP